MAEKTSWKRQIKLSRKDAKRAKNLPCFLCALCVFHEKVGSCQAKSPLLEFEPTLRGRPTGGGTAHRPPDHGPLSLVDGSGSGPRGIRQGRAFLAAACEPLTDPSRPLQSDRRERGRGSQGACPLAEFEAAPHARSSARSPRSVHNAKLSKVAFRSSRTPRSTSCLCLPHACPLVARPASIRILAAFLGAACTIRFFEFGRGAANLSDGFHCNRDAKRSQPRKRGTSSKQEIRLSGSQAESLVLLPFPFFLLPIPAYA